VRTSRGGTEGLGNTCAILDKLQLPQSRTDHVFGCCGAARFFRICIPLPRRWLSTCIKAANPHSHPPTSLLSAPKPHQIPFLLQSKPKKIRNFQTFRLRVPEWVRAVPARAVADRRAAASAAAALASEPVVVYVSPGPSFPSPIVLPAMLSYKCPPIPSLSLFFSIIYSRLSLLAKHTISLTEASTEPIPTTRRQEVSLCGG
jgi:hypothetical protein